jgi:cell fate (sporulation/competence/biofilm development) regulator YmcA (YheA/YmcA/DUF963 family)
MALIDVAVKADVHVHPGEDMKHLERALGQLTIKVSNMATKDEVKAAVAAEHEEVQEALKAQDEKISALQARVDAGDKVTAADFDEIKQAHDRREHLK